MPLKKAIEQRNSQVGIPLPDPDLTVQGFVEAMLNSGRWVVRCPDDLDGKHYVEVKIDQQDFICSGCYPGLRASAFKQREDELFIPVPDDLVRQAAIDQATEDGKVYTILFPEDPASILALLRQRPVENMNWLPGETVDFLMQENVDHNVGSTQPDVTVSGGE